VTTSGMHIIRLTGQGNLVQSFPQHTNTSPGIMGVDSVRLDSFASSPFQATASVNRLRCGDTLRLNSNVTGGNSPFIYQWSGPNNFSATTQNVQIPNATASKNGVYTVKITDKGGCSQQTTVTATVLPIAITTDTNLVLCFKDPIVLTAQVLGGNNLTYKWMYGNSLLGTTNPFTYAGTPGAGIYNTALVVTNSASCTATKNVKVTINALPIPTITGFTTTCVKTTTTLTASGGIRYLWNTTATTPSIQANVGTYTVTATNAAGCKASVSKTVALATAPVINLANQGVVCRGATSLVTISILASNGVAPYRYQWSNGATTQNIANVTTGAQSYCVTVTGANGCESVRCFDCQNPCAANPSIAAPSRPTESNTDVTVLKTVDETVVLEQNRPNPSNDVTTVRYKVPQNWTQMEFVLTDLTGRELKRQVLESSEGDISLELSQITNGQYLYVLVYQGKIRASRKLTVLHAD
jgi:hypothetical protein